MKRIIKIENVEKAFNQLSWYYEQLPLKVKSNSNSEEMYKLNFLNWGMFVGVDNKRTLFNEISYGKTSNLFDYCQQKNFKHNEREYTTLDFRELIFINALLMELFENQCLIAYFKEDWWMHIASNHINEITKDNYELSTINKSWVESKDSISYACNHAYGDKLIEVDIQNAFKSVDIDILKKFLIEDGKDVIKIHFLINILKRISGSNIGIPLLYASENISHTIWNYFFRKVLAKIETTMDIKLVSVVDDITIITNEDYAKGVINFFWNEIRKYNLNLNKDKIKIINREEYDFKKIRSPYGDDWEFHNFGEIEFLNNSEMENFLVEVASIEYEYYKKRNETPFHPSLDEEKNIKYRSMQEKYKLEYDFEKTLLLLKNNFIDGMHNLKNKLLLLLDEMIIMMKNNYETMSSEDLSNILQLINKNADCSPDFIKIIDEKDSSITSTFAWRYKDFIRKKELDWSYEVNRQNQFISELSSTQRNLRDSLSYSKMISISENWGLGVALVFNSGTHFHATDKFTQITSAYSICSWAHNTYLNGGNQSTKWNNIEISFNKWLKNFNLYRDNTTIAELRNNSPITHCPTNEQNSSIMKGLDIDFEINDILQIIKSEVDKNKKER